MTPFDFQLRTRFVYGPGTINQLGPLASELGARRALMVSDAGIVAAGHAEAGLKSLQQAGIATELFTDLHENPTTDDVERGLAQAQRYDPQLIVGLGGGSSMDCAKGINFLYSNGGTMRDYWGVGKALREMLPMIAVPTTAGTGSEAQSFALISDAQTHVKMACGDKKASFRIAILDPQLTRTQPQRLTALTGIDAISHALETFVTRQRNACSQTFSREAWRLLSGNFLAALQQPDNLEVRGAMQLGACYAGLAIENSMLGAAHALANPLTAHCQVVHGQAVALMLPPVLRFNAGVSDQDYNQLLAASASELPAGSSAGERLAGFVQQVASRAGLATRLSEVGVDHQRLDELAAEAAEQWTGSFNPRPVDRTQLLQLYQAAW